ncbi:MAG: hypothetical protein H5T74_04355 [Actinobacteria bacterium]|nr:hypothetical protein [Actinomycetota bacterium]MDI6832198.1 hypothetical protein [Actinomycetota bacterium]
MRRVLVIALIAVFASTALALAAWKVADMVRGEERGSPPGGESSAVGAEAPESGPQDGAAVSVEGSKEAGAEAAGLPGGEDSSYDDPDQRYVTETQRHQNFFIALAEGRIKRLDAVATDVAPGGDANTSYLYFTVTTTDGSKHDGTMVLKKSGGIWRIAAIRQLGGSLGGGTNYVVPAAFEDDLAREINELQEFLSKVAEGRLDYMIVDTVDRVSDTETVLNGKVVGVGGRIESTRMTLHKDFELWHLTSIVSLGRLQ